MSQEKTTLEIIAPTIEEAIAKGLNQLGLPREAVDAEVLDAGSRGLFGLGSRQARVRLAIRGAESKPAASAPVEEPQEPDEFADVGEEEIDQDEQERLLIITSPVDDAFKGSRAQPEDDRPSVEGDEHGLEVAQHVVEELLERMRVRAAVKTRYIQPQDSHEQPVILVDIQGNDLSILIGRRTETLNALQYISSLIIGKELGRWTPLMIDVQGYRVRRERSLRQLARRMADQAIHTGKRQVLEPMTAAERRVIHLELRDHTQVATESTGEEPNRKVTVFLKKN
jgi:spoIIIJ-associated protein